MEVKNSYCENFKDEEIDKFKDDIPKFLEQCVESIANKEGFISHNVKSTKISTEGGNYMAVLYTIDIKGKTNNGDKEVNLFVKNIVSFDNSLESFISPADPYINEAYVYKDLSKVFKILEDKAGIPVEERYKMVKGYDESSSEAIILENVAIKGFKTCERRKVVPLRFVELSVEQLAKLHALGFAVKKVLPDFFEQKLSKMKNPVKLNEHWAKFYRTISKISLKSLRQELKNKSEVFLQTAPEKYARYMNDTTTIRTLCHGDFRNLNILMKEKDGVVTEIIPVDLQLVHYGCPANDILYFIYGCTDRQFRKQHMDNVVDLYYDTLTNYLKYFDIDVVDVYPRGKFDAAMKERADFGLIVSIGFYPFFFTPEDSVPDLSQDAEAIDMTLDPEIVGRLEEVIEDAVELGLL